MHKKSLESTLIKKITLQKGFTCAKSAAIIQNSGFVKHENQKA